MELHTLLDTQFGPHGDAILRRRLAEGADPNARDPQTGETPLHVATRRRRAAAVAALLDHGAAIDARTRGGKTAYVHALRRGFSEVASMLAQRGSDTSIEPADALAIAVGDGRLDEAAALLQDAPSLVRTGNPEEDRLLADMAGRDATAAVAFLVDAGADPAAVGLDGGAALHQSAWFGQPRNARLLLDAGADVDDFDNDHESSPLGWAVHGSRYSAGARERQDAYVELVQMLLDAGARLHYPDAPKSDAYWQRLLRDATPRVLEVLERTNDRRDG